MQEIRLDLGAAEIRRDQAAVARLRGELQTAIATRDRALNDGCAARNACTFGKPRLRQALARQPSR